MRQAVSKAINRPAIVDALLFGEGEPLYGPITTADRYYAKEVEAYNQYDVDGPRPSSLNWAGPPMAMAYSRRTAPHSSSTWLFRPNRSISSSGRSSRINSSKSV